MHLTDLSPWQIGYFVVFSILLSLLHRICNGIYRENIASKYILSWLVILGYVATALVVLKNAVGTIWWFPLFFVLIKLGVEYICDYLFDDRVGIFQLDYNRQFQNIILSFLLCVTGIFLFYPLFPELYSKIQSKFVYSFQKESDLDYVADLNNIDPQMENTSENNLDTSTISIRSVDRFTNKNGLCTYLFGLYISISDEEKEENLNTLLFEFSSGSEPERFGEGLIVGKIVSSGDLEIGTTTSTSKSLLLARGKCTSQLIIHSIIGTFDQKQRNITHFARIGEDEKDIKLYVHKSEDKNYVKNDAELIIAPSNLKFELSFLNSTLITQGISKELYRLKQLAGLEIEDFSIEFEVEEILPDIDIRRFEQFGVGLEDIVKLNSANFAGDESDITFMLDTTDVIENTRRIVSAKAKINGKNYNILPNITVSSPTVIGLSVRKS